MTSWIDFLIGLELGGLFVLFVAVRGGREAAAEFQSIHDSWRRMRGLLDGVRGDAFFLLDLVQAYENGWPATVMVLRETWNERALRLLAEREGEEDE